jgi:glutaredoxin-dependent peroxiredoxin
VRPLAVSRDSAWSHAAWAGTLGVEVPLLSDWNGEVTRAFGVELELLGMEGVASRSCFLIEDGVTVRAPWLLGAELPDIDAIIETVRELAA